MTREEFDAQLREQIASGEITPDEAEHEWRESFDPEPRYGGQEW